MYGGGLLPLAAQQLRRYLHEVDRRVAPAPILAQTAGENAAALNGTTIHLGAAARCPPGASYIVERPNSNAASLLACDELGAGSLHAVTDLLSALGLFFTAEGPPFLPASARAHAVEANHGQHDGRVGQH